MNSNTVCNAGREVVTWWRDEVPLTNAFLNILSGIFFRMFFVPWTMGPCTMYPKSREGVWHYVGERTGRDSRGRTCNARKLLWLYTAWLRSRIGTHRSEMLCLRFSNSREIIEIVLPVCRNKTNAAHSFSKNLFRRKDFCTVFYKSFFFYAQTPF